MNFVGKYTFTVPTPSGERETRLFLRNYYDGQLHGTLHSAHGGIEPAKNISCQGRELKFEAKAGPANLRFSFDISDDGGFTGKASVTQKSGEAAVSGIRGHKTEITPEDDGADKIQMKKKALILYCTITKNTERVAVWFKETFEHYGMETTLVRIKNNMDWTPYEGKLYIEDYDVVCMGSPIIGGSPMQCMLKYFSAGAASGLEDRVAKNAEAGAGFNAGGAGGFSENEVRDGSPDGAAPPPPPPPPAGGKGPGPRWQRPENAAMLYPGGPHKRGLFKPLGIAFTTYGGGFRGSNEAMPTLELLKLYLEEKGLEVIGKFCCCGKEFGPAGLDDGIPPVQIHEPPVYYRDADGNYHAGSFFFHCHSNSRPGPREEAKAKAFVADIVEDHFYTSDGIRREPRSEYISMS